MIATWLDLVERCSPWDVAVQEQAQGSSGREIDVRKTGRIRVVRLPSVAGVSVSVGIDHDRVVPAEERAHAEVDSQGVGTVVSELVRQPGDGAGHDSRVPLWKQRHEPDEDRIFRQDDRAGLLVGPSLEVKSLEHPILRGREGLADDEGHSIARSGGAQVELAVAVAVSRRVELLEHSVTVVVAPQEHVATTVTVEIREVGEVLAEQRACPHVEAARSVPFDVDVVSDIQRSTDGS